VGMPPRLRVPRHTLAIAHRPSSRVVPVISISTRITISLGSRTTMPTREMQISGQTTLVLPSSNWTIIHSLCHWLSTKRHRSYTLEHGVLPYRTAPWHPVCSLVHEPFDREDENRSPHAPSSRGRTCVDFRSSVWWVSSVPCAY